MDIDPIEDLDQDESEVEFSGQWWSLSALKTIQTCGKQYEYRYIIKEKTKPTPFLAFGKAVHKVIEVIHKENNFSDSFWQREWERLWYEQSSKVDWKGYKKATFSNMGTKMLGSYVDDNQETEVMASELRFPKKDEHYMLGDYQIRGVIDQIRKTETKPLVIDFKTSTKEPDPLILRADPQWTLYWDYARKRLGVEDVSLGLYHLKSGKIFPTERTEKDLEIVLESLKDAQAKVDQKMFSRSIGFNCHFCDFREQCLGSIATNE